MSDPIVFALGAVLFTLTTSATFLFLMLRFNEVYESESEELASLEQVGMAVDRLSDEPTGPGAVGVDAASSERAAIRGSAL